ncbi:hypothetical protein FH972_024060 [Carpinus fangiana]|uniref:Uncharacterized protein n=1 Tax=Carpinus fangiana TaxID=176857 RepID=A0A5N6KXF3_9ROSI|nr:hypothetical protein FH972_024060 [Carpinus fangiana]
MDVSDNAAHRRMTMTPRQQRHRASVAAWQFANHRQALRSERPLKVWHPPGAPFPLTPPRSSWSSNSVMGEPWDQGVVDPTHEVPAVSTLSAFTSSAHPETTHESSPYYPEQETSLPSRREQQGYIYPCSDADDQRPRPIYPSLKPPSSSDDLPLRSRSAAPAPEPETSRVGSARRPRTQRSPATHFGVPTSSLPFAGDPIKPSVLVQPACSSNEDPHSWYGLSAEQPNHPLLQATPSRDNINKSHRKEHVTPLPNDLAGAGAIALTTKLNAYGRDLQRLRNLLHDINKAVLNCCPPNSHEEVDILLNHISTTSIQIAYLNFNRKLLESHRPQVQVDSVTGGTSSV